MGLLFPFITILPMSRRKFRVLAGNFIGADAEVLFRARIVL